MTFKASSLKSGYRRNAGKRWRGDDLKRLRRLVNTGAPLGAISLQLGRPGSAIRAKAAEIGLRIEMDEPRTGGAPRRAAAAGRPGQARQRRDPRLR